ncbi:MAG TPA: hypothetical protein VGK22_10015 [Candidatus Angelobacter sp.]|jgi:hypothetical protein
MSLLNLLFVFAMAASQQSSTPTLPSVAPNPPAQTMSADNDASRKLLAATQENTCYTMRSYLFRRQDGQAPVPAGMTTCTRANVFQQRQLTSVPRGLYVPLSTNIGQPKAADSK